MVGKCSHSECVAPISCHIHGGINFEKCEYFVSAKKKTNNSTVKSKNGKSDSRSNVPWTGEWIRPEELNSIAARNAPILLSVVGKADAGKTSFLGMVYTLLLHGKKLKRFDFAGSKTLIGWDQLHFDLVINKGKVTFSDPTPVGVNRIYHIAGKSDSRLVDVLFSDASGETFTSWSQNRDDENGVNARWVHAKSDGFIFFVDCEALISSLSFAKNEILDIGQQLSHDLNDRPVVVVWSKADKLKDVPVNIIDSIRERIQSLFKVYIEINISNLLGSIPDDYVHKNNLQVVDWLLERILVAERIDLSIPSVPESSDIFLNFKRV